MRFLTRYDGEVSEPLVGRQGSRVSMRVARGSASLLPSHGRGMFSLSHSLSDRCLDHSISFIVPEVNPDTTKVFS